MKIILVLAVSAPVRNTESGMSHLHLNSFSLQWWGTQCLDAGRDCWEQEQLLVKVCL